MIDENKLEYVRNSTQNLKNCSELNMKQFIKKENEKLIKVFLKFEPFISTSCEKQATKSGNIEEIKSALFEIPEFLTKEDKNSIIQAKQKILNEYTEAGWSAIHYAIFYHQNEISEYLIKM